MQFSSLKKIFLTLLLFSQCLFAYNQEDSDYYKLKQVLEYIDDYYVDTIDIANTIDKVIIATLKELDPHSTYFTKEDVEKVNQPLIGNFEGIGVYYNIVQDTVVVISTISGGPSEKVGVKAGDRIVQVEGENIANIDITNEGVKSRLAGLKGTKVKIGIKRKSSKDIIEFTITRDKIPIFSIDAAYMIDDEVGYIKLNKFSATSKQEFEDAVKKLDKEGLKHLIFDLRENGGGYLSAAVDISDEFLDKEELIVYTEGVNSVKKEYFATNDGAFEKGRLIILIDEGTASASEIVSGAIQDWDRGLIMGRRSYGKGLVQKPYDLADGSMIRLTIARYFTPTGRLIQKSYDEGVDKYKEDIQQRILNGELFNSDSIHLPDSLKFYTLENKRLVYGGGGIMPDVFIPLDTTGLPDIYEVWLQNGIINDFALKYSDDERENIISKYSDFKIFASHYLIDDNFYISLSEFANSELKNDSIYNLDELKNDSIVNTQLKALIARNVWTENEYYYILNTTSDVYIEAIELIKEKNLYDKKLKN